MSRKEDRLRVTLEEVAADAGVSPTAASLILRHQQKYLSHFRPGTVQRVFESARRLGYRSNLFALSLNTTESLFFAIVLHVPASGQPNDWLTKLNMDDFLVGAVEVACKAGTYPIVGMAGLDNHEAALHSIVDLIGGGVFATLIQTPNAFLEEVMRDRLKHRNLVAVAFPRRMADWESNAIDADNVRIAELAAELLSLQGRRKWAIVYEDSGCEGLILRQTTFERLANEAGIAVQGIRLPLSSDHLIIREVIVDQLNRLHLDGLFAPTLMASVGALLACRRLGLEPGKDLTIIGCDCDRWSRGSSPQLTYVDVSWNEAGRLAAQRLLELRESHEHRFENILLPPRVVFGDTCPVPESFRGIETASRTHRDATDGDGAPPSSR
jgi:LacI family transcriptional regulator